MSTLWRIGSASVAAWARIAVTVLAQILLVPIFLARWDQQTYGVWLAIQAAISLSILIDVGHQTFVGYEFLRLGSARRESVRRVFSAAIPFAFALGVGELLVLIFAVSMDWERVVFGASASASAAGQVLIIQAVVWLITGSLGGMVVRLVAPFGYYARMSWWGLYAGLLTSLLPAIAVWFGASLLGAGISLAAATLAVNAPLYWDLWQILRREKLLPERPDWGIGWRNFLLSLSLTLKSFFEMGRQQGVRLVLSPLTGTAEMAAFATMRTGSNMALQGLGTITNPLLPELMRFLNGRDQDRTEAAFGLVWFVVAAVLTPSVIAVQFAAPWLFPLWTHGKIEFDGILFAMLSVGVLIFAVAQPPMAVVQGNNLLRPQLAISAVSGVVAIGGLFFFVPSLGIRGAAAVLMLAEGVSLVAYVSVAARWLRENDLLWPTEGFRRVLVSTAVASAGVVALAIWPTYGYEIVAVASILLAATGYRYWLSIPKMARNRVTELIRLRAT